MSRGKKLVILVGANRAIQTAVDKAGSSSARYSLLDARLQQNGLPVKNPAEQANTVVAQATKQIASKAHTVTTKTVSSGSDLNLTFVPPMQDLVDGPDAVQIPEEYFVDMEQAIQRDVDFTTLTRASTPLPQKDAKSTPLPQKNAKIHRELPPPPYRDCGWYE